MRLAALPSDAMPSQAAPRETPQRMTNNIEQKQEIAKQANYRKEKRTPEIPAMKLLYDN